MGRLDMRKISRFDFSLFKPITFLLSLLVFCKILILVRSVLFCILKIDNRR